MTISDDVRWIVRSSVGALATFLLLVTVLWRLGLFDFSGTEASATVVAASLALVGAFVGSAVTFVGLLLAHSANRRTAELKDEAEKRLKLEAAIRAVSLLHTESDRAVPKPHTAGVLFALTELGLVRLAVTMLAQMLPSNRIDSDAATWIISRGLKEPDEELQTESATVLYQNAQHLLIEDGEFVFPGPFDVAWTPDLPELAREMIALARLKLIRARSRHEWSEGAINAHITALAAIWNGESTERIKADVGLFLRHLIRLHKPDTRLFTPSGPLKVTDLSARLSTALPADTRPSALATPYVDGMEQWLGSSDVAPDADQAKGEPDDPTESSA